MITLSDIYVQYGNRILLDRVTVVIGDKDNVGLVGRNGAGKSTLLKIIARYQRPDEGNIAIPSDRTIGFLHQEMNIPKGKSVMQETLTAFEEARKIEQRIAELNQEMEERTDYESDAYSKIVEEFSTLNDRFLFLGGDRMEAQAEMVLKGLGFAQGDFQRLTDEFSGGWQMRIELAKMLLAQPDYLLLDEPTNHLDIESIIWLEQFLQTYPGSVVVISHDKEFLDNVTKRTVEVEQSKLFDYKAPYSKYVELREERREKLGAAFNNQQKVIAQRERTINRFMAKATKTKLAQSMQKQLDKMERIELDEADTKAMILRFPPAPRSGAIVVEGQKISKSYGQLNVLDQINLKLDRGDRVAHRVWRKINSREYSINRAGGHFSRLFVRQHRSAHGFELAHLPAPLRRPCQLCSDKQRYPGGNGPGCILGQKIVRHQSHFCFPSNLLALPRFGARAS